jgi:hypothetical protein
VRADAGAPTPGILSEIPGILTVRRVASCRRDNNQQKQSDAGGRWQVLIVLVELWWVVALVVAGLVLIIRGLA